MKKLTLGSGFLENNIKRLEGWGYEGPRGTAKLTVLNNVIALITAACMVSKIKEIDT